MPSWQDIKDILGRVHREELIFLVVVVSVVIGVAIPLLNGAAGSGQTTDLGRTAGLTVLMGGVVVLALGGLWMHYRQVEKDKEREHARNKQHDELKKQIELLGGQLKDLSTPTVSIITKLNYPALIKAWNDSGPGHLLLYNIELQSFLDDTDLERTWGSIAEMTNIKTIELMLPKEKIARWEQVVRTHQGTFFANPRNRKFNVTTPKDEDTAPRPIGFALYVLGDRPTHGTVHDTSLMFILCPPFSVAREARLAGEARPPEQWWDYFHVPQFHGEKLVVDSLARTWNDQYNPSVVRGIDRVLEDVKELEPIPPDRLFDLLQAPESRKRELLALFEDRELPGDGDPPRIEPQQVVPNGAAPDVPFTLAYTNGDRIIGRCVGADEDDKPAVIWVGGFTENENTNLSDLFAKVLSRTHLVQFYYRNSSPLRDITLTRYEEDMREVIKYAARQPAVDRNRVVLVARSINGFLATRVAADPHFRDRVAGVVLVAPVFDVMEMIDNYRARQREGTEVVRVETCWRRKPGYTASKWEDPNNGWMEFYGQHLSLALFADIIRHHPDEFSLKAFVNAVGKITEDRPVCVLSNPNDPVTGSARAVQELNRAVDDGLIRSDRFEIIEIKSQHNLERQFQGVFAIRDEVSETRDALRRLFDSMGLSAVPPAKGSSLVKNRPR